MRVPGPRDEEEKDEEDPARWPFIPLLLLLLPLVTSSPKAALPGARPPSPDRLDLFFLLFFLAAPFSSAQGPDLRTPPCCCCGCRTTTTPSSLSSSSTGGAFGCSREDLDGLPLGAAP